MIEDIHGGLYMNDLLSLDLGYNVDGSVLGVVVVPIFGQILQTLFEEGGLEVL